MAIEMNMSRLFSSVEADLLISPMSTTGTNCYRMAKEHADVAQLVEQLIRNQQVNGSSPFVGSIPSPSFFNKMH